jgi:hypothetical protein
VQGQKEKPRNGNFTADSELMLPYSRNDVLEFFCFRSGLIRTCGTGQLFNYRHHQFLMTQISPTVGNGAPRRTITMPFKLSHLKVLMSFNFAIQAFAGGPDLPIKCHDIDFHEGTCEGRDRCLSTGAHWALTDYSGKCDWVFDLPFRN